MTVVRQRSETAVKKLLKTLYITTPGTYLHCENDTVSVILNKEEKTRIPAHMLESIVCIGNTTVSTPLIGYCGQHNISLSFHSDSGRFYGRMYGPVSGNVLLRKRQFEIANNDEMSVNLVRNILYGKICNSRNLLMKSENDISDIYKKEQLKKASSDLANIASGLSAIENTDSLRGAEGAAAQTYFRVFDCMIKSNEQEMMFDRRSKHPPLNNVNALMSFLYMLLKNDVQSALESVGLDPACGYLHAFRPGRPSLALDMMEELRAPLCDRMALSLINLKQITAKDFEVDGERIKMNDKARKLVISKWQSRKEEIITHKFLGEKIKIGLIPYAQSMLLARVIRGDLDEYPPFVWR